MALLYLILFSYISLISCKISHTRGDTSFYSKLDNVVYDYFNEINTEDELELCRPDSICSVVNRRFWFPSRVYRVCSCSKSPCPFEWSNDNRSIPLDNRSQLKTCEDTYNMEACSEAEIGIKVTEKKIKKIWVKDISLKCRCDWPAYWRLSSASRNSTLAISEYTCSKFHRCQSGEFCGNVRVDTHSTYYQCSCPKGHLCLNKDKKEKNATELLYLGPVYRAYCLPYQTDKKL